MTTEKLLVSYWLNSENQTNSPQNSIECLRQFAKEKNYMVSDKAFLEAAHHLDGELTKGDVDQWIVFVCFLGHPHALWNLMLDAVTVADSDKHLGKIAVGLAEHILAHYGSMISHFEKQALRDHRFKRMLTGVWRHRMSDNVWARLRVMQSNIPAPLSTMDPLEYGVEHLGREDRENADKGPYLRDANGDWQKVKERQ